MRCDCGCEFEPVVEYRHLLACGDCGARAVLDQVLVAGKPALVVTDPPYGVEYDPTWRRAAGINKSAGRMGKVANDDRVDWAPVLAALGAPVMYVWHAGRFTGEVEAGLRAAGYEPVAQIVWVKDHFALSRGDYHWQHEPCWYVVLKGAAHNWQGARDQATVWEIPRVDRDEAAYGHGTQKPLECMARPIRNNSQPGDWVADPFSGSGTTLIACEQLGRRCAAVELNPGYIGSILERWFVMTSLPPVLLSEAAQ